MIALIPAYRPDKRLLLLVDELLQQTDYKVLVVNDGSGEKYDEIFSALPSEVTLLTHEVNKGKGRAMKTGFSYIRDHHLEDLGVVIVDADGQHLLPDIIRVCDALKAHPNSLIIGSRKFTGNVPFRSRFGNKLTQYVFALASGVKLSDTQTGLRAIPLTLLDQLIELKGERYEYEMNMLLHFAQQGIPMQEVFIETVYLDNNSSSHFNVFRDSLKIYAVIFTFVLSSLTSYVIDFVMLFVLTACTKQLDAEASLFISVVGARICSSICNFFINKKVVFKTNGKLASSLVKYYILAAIILAANLGLMNLFNLVIGIPLFWAKVVTELLLFFFSFVAQRSFVFKKKPALK